jgi:hypothetical protein
MVKDQIVPQNESSSESCLHCEINDLVPGAHRRAEKVDIMALAAKMAERLVELVLLAPDEEQSEIAGRYRCSSDTRFSKEAGRLKRTRIRRIDAVFRHGLGRDERIGHMTDDI